MLKSQFTLLSALVSTLLLGACASTEVVETHPIKNDHQTRLAACEVANTSISEAEDCAVANDGVIEVIHPQQEIALEIKTTSQPEAKSAEPEAVVVTDVWQRIGNQLTFAIPENKRVKVQRNWYLKHPEYMSRVTNRARPFLYFIAQEIESRNMPLELALLPIVESAFDPFAYSHGRAAGMWQFIPSTAKRFGIHQSWWYDGRRDVIASTQGALDYLEYLHNLFDGNWLHALAAYNSGEGRVKRAIKRNIKAGKPTDFWSLNLPRETRAYVPKLLALADILKKKDKYDFTWPKVENVAVIDVVEIGSQVDLAFAADLAEMDLEALQALNPGFNRWATDPDGPHYLVLPLEIADSFSQKLDAIDQTERLNWVRHRVERGDSLLKLAHQYHTTAQIIKQVNNLSSNIIRSGDHLLVPVALKELSAYTLSNEQRLATTQNRKRADRKFTYTVQSGDTLWDIGRKYKVSPQKLAKWNGMAPIDTLRPGMSLAIWLDDDGSQSDAIMKKLTYTVRKGDSLSRIASKFNIKINDIRKWNDLQKSRYLQPGQKLTLHVDVTRLKNVS
ncbi:LysM peptidoglycan-binding domain-containing protein [Alteromonas sp. ASW11-130]|uniref:LysM peptidoglycan-binding domain-containing protein n=1 Tax=Alteromonas sp. ASW11-130 TaxID=3015775 RepID=UPI0022425591|nr:LysM peptidoglycan-binding domain-containing protein [Alteromonas sp. ASW11-130]MCW8092766.1 LysM peptidoglycan-binding domain-containing protein [Alteromonas sp. ASW11-130]